MINESYSKITVQDENCAILVICSFFNYSVLHVCFVNLVCVVFLHFGSFKCFGVKCGIYFAEQIYMGGLGLFFTHELPLCCDHDYYCFCPSHSKFPVGCGFHMLKALWGHLNVLYFNSYSLLIVICWCIYDISRYPFSF
jgi:hypothetical protein